MNAPDGGLTLMIKVPSAGVITRSQTSASKTYAGSARSASAIDGENRMTCMETTESERRAAPAYVGRRMSQRNWVCVTLILASSKRPDTETVRATSRSANEKPASQ